MKQLIDDINAYLIHYGMEPIEIKDATNDDDQAYYPFNKIVNVLAYLLSKNYISYEEYEKLYRGYNKRNKYLYLFDMPTRNFGESYFEHYLCNIDSAFKKPTKNLYPEYDGEYDLIVDGQIHVEVKANRANRAGDGSLVNRAYSHNEALENNFKYHFQQIKPSCCDEFILIGVCTDKILYWVVPSNEIVNLNFSNQHRRENEDSNDIFEGQVFITEPELQNYKVEENDLINTIRIKFNQH